MKSQIYKYSKISKPLFTLLAIFLISISSFAQGHGINYKAVIKDDSGNVMANQNLKVKFTILDFDDNIGYQETHTTTTDSNGIVILVIRDGTENVTGTLYGLDWGNQLYKLKVDVDIEPYNTFFPLGTSFFFAVPLAFHAETASTAVNASGLNQITEYNGTQYNTGWRLAGRDPNNYGSIGKNAVDLSNSSFSSTTVGATGWESIASGYRTKASGSYTFAMGYETLAEAAHSVVIGRYNKGGFTPGGVFNGDISWKENDPLFEIGNGTDNSNRKNALTVLKNGNIGLGNITTPEEQLHLDGYIRMGNILLSGIGSSFEIGNATTDTFNVGLYDIGWEPTLNDAARLGSNSYRWSEIWSVNPLNTSSDRRLKKDINPIIYGLDAIMHLKPVSYKWKKGQLDTKLGFIAQDVKSVIPEIVKLEITSAEKKAQYKKEGREVPLEDYYAMSYTELIPVLVKALQEQQAIIDGQNSKIEAQHSENTQQNQAIQSLLQRMNALETANN